MNPVCETKGCPLHLSESKFFKSENVPVFWGGGPRNPNTAFYTFALCVC